MVLLFRAGDIVNDMSLQALTSNFTNQIMPNLNKADSGAAAEAVESTGELVTKSKPESNFFSNFLAKSSASTEVTVDDMQSRFSDLRRKGQLMQHHPIPEKVKDYIGDVRDFLSDLRDGAYSSQSKEGVFEKVAVVNEKLDEMSDEFLNGQTNEMALVASLGELEGLLVDIFV